MFSLDTAAYKLVLSALSVIEKIKNSLNVDSKGVNSSDPFHGILCKRWINIY